MPRFEPFCGVRYDTTRAPAGDVTAPPYDVISPTDRAALILRHPDNVVQIDLPDEADGPGRYKAAAATFQEWLASGVLRRDADPSFYVYRMDYSDDHQRPAHTLGVMGALELSRPGEGQILPHEHTTPKAKSDRLDLLRATSANLSPVWALSLTEGLTDACRIERDPDLQFTDTEGVTHTLWRVADEATVGAIREAVDASPVVIADGHHRYETSLAYRDERRETEGPGGPADAFLCFVVELADDELTVRPIHRLLDGFADGFDLEAALESSFTLGDVVPVDDEILDRMDAAGALALVRPDGSARLLVPEPEAFDGVADLDSSRLDAALADLPPHEIRYQHGVGLIAAAVAGSDAQYGVLLRPATVAQIQTNAHTGERMPPKTTFFHPKLRTGLVFREVV
ncbi:MAG TPA: DUF1015 domain-containing protein [Acidimicrobiales bacterium]|nr:DUF1015 domain-containing protein [Acidimicrobiales bacterium]